MPFVFLHKWNCSDHNYSSCESNITRDLEVEFCREQENFYNLWQIWIVIIESRFLSAVYLTYFLTWKYLFLLEQAKTLCVQE